MAALKLEIMPAAERHIDTACVYYAGHGNERTAIGLLREVRDVLDRIAVFPLSCPLYHRATRRKLLDTFPYWVYYRIDGETVRVFAFLHAHRDPTFLKRMAR